MIIPKYIIETNPNNGYVAYHAPRYVSLLQLLSEYISDNSKMLDIGSLNSTRIIHEYFNMKVDSLGFDKDQKTEVGNNYQFDLNNSQFEERWRTDIPKYNVIIMAEVIEHLYTSPLLVLKFLKTLLTENGLLIIQTPNAVALHKRIKLLFGKNPYELIREDNTNPGHFREYTSKELMKYSVDAGFVLEKYTFGNYFDYRFRSHAIGKYKKNRYYGILNLLYTIIPQNFKPGITLVLRLA